MTDAQVEAAAIALNEYLNLPEDVPEMVREAARRALAAAEGATRE